MGLGDEVKRVLPLFPLHLQGPFLLPCDFLYTLTGVSPSRSRALQSCGDGKKRQTATS